MDSDLNFYAAFAQGAAAGIFFVLLIAAASTALLVYLLRNFGQEECEHYDIPDKVADIEEWR